MELDEIADEATFWIWLHAQPLAAGHSLDPASLRLEGELSGPGGPSAAAATRLAAALGIDYRDAYTALLLARGHPRLTLADLDLAEGHEVRAIEWGRESGLTPDVVSQLLVLARQFSPPRDDDNGTDDAS